MNIGINTKKLRARNRRARRNLALKLVLENTFRPEVSAYFNSIRRKLINDFKETGIVPSIQKYTDDTRELLEKQYMRVSNSFRNEMRLFLNVKNMINILEKKQENQEDQVNEVIDAMLAVFIANTTNQHSQLIDTTTQQNINSSFQSATSEAIEKGQGDDIDLISALAFTELGTNFRGRSDAISLTETQISAEGTKQIEAAVISREGEIDPSILIIGTVIAALGTNKEWAAILDQVTRDSHVSANGQLVPANNVFVLDDGSRLRFPGDTSLGAPPSQTVSCRCGALYTV